MRPRSRWAIMWALAVLFAGAALATDGVLARSAPAAGADEAILALTARDGTVRHLTLADVMALPVYEGYAGYDNSTHRGERAHPIRGARLADVLAVAGYDETTDVIVKGLDGYVKSFTPEGVRGQGLEAIVDKRPWLPAEWPADNPPTVVLAYAEDLGSGMKLVGPPPNGKGPLRLYVAYEKPMSPGLVVDGGLCVKWVDRIRVSTTRAEQWSVRLQGPKRVYTLTRSLYETCYNCHRSRVKVGGHEYRGVPLYILVGRIDDDGPRDNFGDFRVRLARAGYQINFRSKSGRSVSISSRLLVKRPMNVTLAWMRDGRHLSGSRAPLWLVSPKLRADQRLAGIERMRLVGVR